MGKRLGALALVLALGIAGPSLATAIPFSELDKNNDGKLSEEEASGQEGLDFAKADTNKDGSLDQSEYQAATG